MENKENKNWKHTELVKDPKNRTIKKGNKEMEVYLCTLTFEDPWNSETASETMQEFADAIKSLPDNKIMYPIINTRGNGLKFNIQFMSLIGLQGKLGSQILVNASKTIESLGSVFASVGSDLHFVETLKEAEDLRDKLIEEGKTTTVEPLKLPE